MIYIKIDNPDYFKNDILVKKSIFISFDYDPDIVEYIKTFSKRRYNTKTKTWEMPINNIVPFCNHFDQRRIQVSGTYETLQDEFIKEIPKDYEFKTKPFDHQIEGVRFALTKDRFLLCDDQGLGKTKQIIDWVGCLSKTTKINKVLIICGVNSLKYNWLNEIATHSGEKGWVLGTRYRKTTGKVYEGSTAEKLQDLSNLPSDTKYIITNVESLRAGAKKISARKYIFPVAEKLKRLCDNGTFSVICADEIHKMKNPASQQGKAFSMLQATYMSALSGTPLMNNPLDLYMPINWLGFEHNSYYAFKCHYCIFGGFNKSEIVGYKNLEDLRELMGAVMLRRLKNEVLDLPDKIHQFEYVDLKPRQTKIYREVQAGIMSNINKIKFSNNPLSMLIRLRQATGYTGILSNEIKESAKLDRMVELVDEIVGGGGKAIIFSNWSDITSIAKEMLKDYRPAYITGETKAKDRMNQVDRFQNDDNCKVIIGTIGAMGTGLTLTAGQNVIFLDSPWNRALKDQAEDRAHRIGTKGTVNIITLVTKNTIDERIEQLVERKGKMSDALIDGKVSMQDLDFLLS